MISLSIEHLGKRYWLGKKRQRELWALRGVSFDVSRGTILGIIGPNGAGKTTLLKVLARITRPTEGRAIGHGRVVPLLAMGSGFQADLTTRENVFLNAAMHGIPARDVRRKFDEIVEFAGIADALDMPLKGCPSGVYLRLAFAVAVSLEPDVILADEVLAVGDVEFQERCMRRVEEAGTEGVTVLFVSHSMAEITRLCDRVVWLDRGEIVRIGDPMEIVSAYQNAAWSIDDRNSEEATGSHVGALGRILHVKPTASDGREVGALRVSDPARVEIAFVVAGHNVGSRCALDFHTAKLGPAFRAVQPGSCLAVTPGVYKAHVEIPQHLLAEGIYVVDATVVLDSGTEREVLRQHQAVSFQVYDTDEAQSARGSFTGKYPGAVRPRLQWSLARG